ncbi:MAG: tRNA pseudouridine(38-40) synthase TruA [Clostridia bacterium]|nr:tRNA pseudouridine(38-40) synthase TruA [Clostridia bacterium]
MKYLFKLSYLGSAYCGWQVQKSAPTVQGVLQNACAQVFKKPYLLTGCSRTDSKVHAREYYAMYETEESAPSLSPESVLYAVNAYLPSDISLLDVSIIEDGSFHPRYSVKSKEYEYVISNSKIKDPFLSDRAYHYPRNLNCDLMNVGAQKLVGKHDFAAFMASGSDVTDTVRTIYSFSVTREADLVKIRVCADGFLYNMVRILSGTLVEISEGKIDPRKIDEIIESKDRAKAGRTLPPQGLYLNRVYY